MHPRHSKSQPANTLPGLLDSALRSKRLRIMDRMDGRSCGIPPLFTIRILPSCHSPITLLQRDLRRLRFNLTRHYYVFHRDSFLVKFHSHNPDLSSPRSSEDSYVYLRYRVVTKYLAQLLSVYNL